MLFTGNYGLKKPAQTDNYDIDNENYNMDIIDNGLCPFYVATSSGANTYAVTTGLGLTSLQDGFSIRVAIPNNSTGAVSIVVDNVTVALKKPNGNAVSNLKANGVYALTYFNGNFILASGGGSDAESTSVGTDGSNVKVGETFIGTDGEIHTGTFTADATATVNDILKDKTAYVNGNKLIGEMINNGAKTASLNCGVSYTIPQGYHNGQGKITANSLASQTSGTATASQILSGYTAWVNGNPITGTATIKSLGGIGYVEGSVSCTSTGSTTFDFTLPTDAYSGKNVICWMAWSNATNATGYITFKNSSTWMYYNYTSSKTASFTSTMPTSASIYHSGNVSSGSTGTVFYRVIYEP